MLQRRYLKSGKIYIYLRHKGLISSVYRYFLMGKYLVLMRRLAVIKVIMGTTADKVIFLRIVLNTYKIYNMIV